MALQPMKEVIGRERDTWVIQQVVLLFIVVVQQAKERERAVLAERRRAPPHGVDVAVEL